MGPLKLTTCVAKRLPYADHIIALGTDSQICEQGKFSDLNATGGYVSGFSLPPPEWNYEWKKEPACSSPTYVYSPPDPNSTTEGIEAEASRQTGDMSIYMYYVRSIGWMPTFIFVVAITAFIFCISFPSKNLPFLL
jgi:hypothetical protein